MLEKAPQGSLAAEISCFPGGSEEVFALMQPQSEESATCATPRAFHSHLCCFSLATLCLLVAILCSYEPSYPEGAGVETVPLSRSKVLSFPQLCTPSSGPQPWLLHEKQSPPLCEPHFLAFSPSSPFVLWLLVCNIVREHVVPSSCQWETAVV